MSIKTFYSGQYEIKKNKENWKKKLSKKIQSIKNYITRHATNLIFSVNEGIKLSSSINALF